MIVIKTTVLIRKDFLINLRLWFSGVTFVHLFFLACKLLTIDFSQSDDPKLRLYHHTRWKLLTCWFNLLMLAYYPLSFYCDCREKRHEERMLHVRVLNRIRHVVFSSIILPTTIFADTLFWRLWNRDRELLVPSSVDEVVPFWTHHCMHSVSLVVVLLDLAIMPRKRPKSLKLNIAVMTTWVVAYLVTVFKSWMQGINVYPLFGILTSPQIIMFCASMYVEHLLFFFLQWCLVDLIYGRSNQKTKASLDRIGTKSTENAIALKETKFL